MNIFNRAKTYVAESVSSIRDDNRPFGARAWSLATLLIRIAIVAGACWLLGAILLLVFPAKWTLLVWLVKAVKTLGKWVFWITSIGALVCYIAGWIGAIIIKNPNNARVEDYDYIHRDEDGNVHIDRRD